MKSIAMLLKIVFSSLLLFFFNTTTAQYVPGSTYLDATGYVEYRAGNLPIIISVPHGGNLEPASIPDRTSGTLIKDSWTKPIGEGMYDALFEQTGCYPHLIINLLHRKKFDANRDIGEAADGNPIVEQSWAAYHDFIDASKAQVVQDYGRGLFMDIHGHAHTIQRIELGYLLSGSELRLSDANLNMVTYIEESSILTLEGDNIQALTHAELLRGEDSFGTLLDDKGFPAVPSFTDPFPDVGEDYFSGGYNTARHGSRDNAGEIDAIQFELNQDVRFNATTRAMLIDSLSTAANEYINLHINDQYLGNFCNLILPVEFLNFSATKEEDKVILNWQTLTEMNNDYFEVQRRVAPNEFRKIGAIAGADYSEEIKNYQFIDEKPENNTNYYRLKQVDNDGKFAFSEILTIDLGKSEKPSFAFYPNPSPAGKLRLKYFSTQEEEVKIRVYNVSGQLVLTKGKYLDFGENQLQLDFSEMHKGIFIVEIENENWRSYKKLVIE